MTSTIGQRFGRLVIQNLERRSYGTRGASGWWAGCACDCGNKHGAWLKNIQNGATSSCGCFYREIRVKRTRPVNRGKNAPTSYRSWESIKSRCFNVNDSVYGFYGGRGITMTPEWIDDPWAFDDYVGPRPSPTHTIDRIDNNGNYEPGNVRWATKKQQSRNTRVVRMLSVYGITRPVFEWSELHGVNINTIRGRISKGWPPEEAVYTRPGGPRRAAPLEFVMRGAV